MSESPRPSSDPTGRATTSSSGTGRTSHEVLCIDADPTVGRGLLALLAAEGVHLSSQVEPGPALEMCETKFFGVVLVDLDTPTHGAGIEVVREVRRRSRESTVIVLTPRKTFEGAVEAFRAGAAEVVWKSPDQVDYLRRRILEALAEARARNELTHLLTDMRALHEETLKILMATDRRAQDAELRASGRDPATLDTSGDIPILCVDGDDRLYKAMAGGQIPGFTFVYAGTGGEALDRISNARFHIALVGPSVPDLPSVMVIRAMKQQAPELIAISYVPNGKLEIVEATRTIPLVDKFNSAKQLAERLNELAEGYRAKQRERRYMQAFRERNYEFLRRFNELRQRMARVAAAHGSDVGAGTSQSIMANLSTSGGWPVAGGG
jgi:two-component system response regulator RegA